VERIVGGATLNEAAHPFEIAGEKGLNDGKTMFHRTHLLIQKFIYINDKVS
jgi:hypothetical protein